MTKATLSVYHAEGSGLAHSLRGYAGNGTIEVTDIASGGTAVSFEPSGRGTDTTVEVTSLVTPSVVASGWAGVAMRKDTDEMDYDFWQCQAGDASYPTLTIDYTVP